MYIENRMGHHNKISEAEFKLTSQIMYLFNIYPANDFELLYDFEDKDGMDQYGLSLTYPGAKKLAYAERFSSLPSIPTSMSVFRPFMNDKHADSIIKLFDKSNIIDYDIFEVSEYKKDDKTKYCGWLMKNNEKIEGSWIKTSPSAPVLKMSIMASLLMDENSHAEYMNNLKEFLGTSDV